MKSLMIDRQGLNLILDIYLVELLQSVQIPRSYIYGMKTYKG